jgi:hypothetical protein
LRSKNIFQQKVLPMKSKFVSQFLALSLVFAAVGVSAQDTVAVQTLPPITITATQKKVPEKVWSSFHSYFANAQYPKCYEINKEYLIKFMTDENVNHALFTKKGEFVYHISFGHENSMPEEVKDAVKSVYYNYQITRAIKVTDGTRLVWVVNLEDAKHLILARTENGEVEEVQRLKKS